MSAKFKLRERVMPLRERESLTREIAADERDMKGDFPEISRGMKKMTENIPGFGLDSASNRKALEQRKQALEKGQVPYLTKHERKLWEDEAKKEALWLRSHGMVPLEDTRVLPSSNGSNSSDFGRIASEISKVEHSPEWLEHAHKWQNIMRTLEPDNSSAGHLDNIRPRRGEAA